MCGNSNDLAYKRVFTKPEITYFLSNFELSIERYNFHNLAAIGHASGAKELHKLEASGAQDGPRYPPTRHAIILPSHLLILKILLWPGYSLKQMLSNLNVFQIAGMLFS